jgi:zinc protease
MKDRPLLVLLAVAAMMGPAAGCRCSGDPQGTTSGGPGAQGTGTGTGTAAAAAPTLAEQSFKLANGMQVDLVSGACGEGAAVAVLIDAGIDHDPAGRSGMARLAGRVLATSAPAGRAERSVETGGDYTVYTVAAAGDRLLEELDEVAAWMSKTAPGEADLERERPRLLEEIGKLAGSDAAATAVSLAEEAVLPTRGNGKRRGIAKEVEAITLAELQAFWQAHFKPGNARVTVAGRFDAEKVRARIEAAFASIPAGTPGVVRAPGDATVKGTLVMGDAPTAVAVAVPAPAMSEPLFGPFLILAARLLEKGAEGRTWEAGYEPLRRPEVLLVTGPVGQAEQPEPAAGRMRKEVSEILARPLAADDVAKARGRFRLLLEPALLDPALCAEDARAFAVARTRRAQLAIDAAALGQAVLATTQEQLDEAAKLFEVKRTAAVIAGGAIR